MPLLDAQEIKYAARGRWSQIICDVGGISDDFLTRQHGPCPKCGGNKPFRVFDDFQETGGAVCSRCGKFGDGIEVVKWSNGIEFYDAIERIANYLGIKPTDKPRLPALKKLKPVREFKKIETHAEDIVPIAWNDIQVRLWCLKKKPLTSESLKAVGAYCARYKGKYTVIAIPCGSNFVIYNIAGGKLPGGEKEWVKVKNINKYPAWMTVERQTQ